MASKVQVLSAMPSEAGMVSAAPATYLQPDELSLAQNVSYGLYAERNKRLGTTPYNATSLGSYNIVALEDFWRFGSSLTPAQQFVTVANGTIYKSTGGGSFGTVSTSFGASNTSLTTNIVTGQGYAVFSDGVNIPQKYDQTAVTPLDGGAATAPTFTAASYHLARLFAIGTAAHPSAFDVSAGGDITTWTGADTLGNIPLDPDDGDALIGISQPFHKRLYIFKGPNKGSIHELSGNTLATLQHDRVFNGLPLHNHKAVITTPNDIFWLSHFGIHSLLTTVQYGDTAAAFLSRPIQDIFQTQIDHTNLNRAVGFWNPLYGVVGWFVPFTGYSTNKFALVYHYLISDPTPNGKKFWSLWSYGGSVAGYSAKVMLTPAQAQTGAALPRLYIGGASDGFVYAGDQSTLSDNGAAYNCRIVTGVNFLNQGVPVQESQVTGVTTFFTPIGSYDNNLIVQIDGRSAAYTVVLSGGGDVLG